jgi:hypothetical protein
MQGHLIVMEWPVNLASVIDFYFYDARNFNCTGVQITPDLFEQK